MTLHAIVAALGGDLYHGGQRANVPAPGHSARDRSVSLMLSEGRVVVHSFGAADWRGVRDALRSRGLIDAQGRLLPGSPFGASEPSPNLRLRLETASRLWEGGVPLRPTTGSALHLRRRGIDLSGGDILNLRHHPTAPVSVYRSGSLTRPALMARISDAGDILTAVELTYLDPNGRRAVGLRLPRKTVGRVPAGSAVRLSTLADDLLVGEGIVTTLSAVQRFRLPGWALMSATNLGSWTAPSGVRRVLIAADRGATGEAAAIRLRNRLLSAGLAARIVLPEPPFGDWNEAAVGAPAAKEGARAVKGAGAAGIGPERPAGEPS
jgi:hypothetical protein